MRLRGLRLERASAGVAMWSPFGRFPCGIVDLELARAQGQVRSLQGRRWRQRRRRRVTRQRQGSDEGATRCASPSDLHPLCSPPLQSVAGRLYYPSTAAAATAGAPGPSWLRPWTWRMPGVPWLEHSQYAKGLAKFMYFPTRRPQTTLNAVLKQVGAGGVGWGRAEVVCLARYAAVTSLHVCG